jgi:hypothetical protein
MRDKFYKAIKYAGGMTSLTLSAGFVYVAIGELKDANETTQPESPSLSTEFENRTAGSPEISKRPQLRPPHMHAQAQPITINLDNGYGLAFEDSDDLFSHENLVNRARYNERYENYDAKTSDLHAGLLALSQITPLSYQAFEAAVWKETRFQPNQNNPSGAKGYFQMKPEAFYEGLYRAQDLFPEIAAVTGLIERTRTKIENSDNYLLEYVPVSDAARAELNRLVHDPVISGLAYYGYLNHYMENFVQAKIPELTAPNQTDLYLISFRGPGGATEFLQHLRATPDEMAHSMYEGGADHPFVAQNKSVYFDAAREQYRTYQEVYDYIADNMGIGRAPVNLDSAAPAHATLVPMNESSGNIIAADALIFDEHITRPVKRPENLMDPPAIMISSN